MGKISACVLKLSVFAILSGAELNTTTKYGRTALHIAAAHGHKGILQFLAQKGEITRENPGSVFLLLGNLFRHYLEYATVSRLPNCIITRPYNSNLA